MPVYQSPTPYDEARIHAAAVYCSDGRVGDQVDEFLLERAAKAVIGIDGALEVRAFFARRRASRIAFEAVPV